jgi:hypothetical protein
MEHLGGPLVNEGGVTETSCCRVPTILAPDQAVGISHRVMAVAVQGAPNTRNLKDTSLSVREDSTVDTRACDLPGGTDRTDFAPLHLLSHSSNARY